MTTKAKKRPQAAVDARTETLEAPAPPERVLTSDEREQALEAAHTEMQRLEGEQIALQADIDQNEQFILHLQASIQDRHRAIQQRAARVNAALQAVEAQEQYCALFAGNAGTTELQRLQRELEQVQSDHTALIGEYAHLNDLDTEHIAQIRATIAQDRATINDLQKTSSTIGAARRKLLAQHGEALYLECSTLLSDLEARSLECKDASFLAERALMDARGAIIRRLAPWPAIRRKLEAEHTISSDGSIEVLENYLHLLDVLVEHGPTVDTLLLSELNFPHQSLLSLASGNRGPIAGRREAIASTLEQYRKTFLAEQGVR